MTTLAASTYSYTLVHDWARWPPGMTPPQVTAVAVDSQDRVYVGCIPDPPVVIFDREGSFLSSWGNGTIGYPHGLYVANDVVYLADRDSSVCILFTLDGKPIQMLGRHGVHSDTGAGHNQPVTRLAGPFNFPCKLVPSPWGDLYAADGHRNARVHRFDSGGHLIQSWGTWGRTAPGEFNWPHSVLVGRDGRVYVCDRDNDRVQVFSRNGEFIAMWTEVMGPGDIAQTPGGDFAVTERKGGPEYAPGSRGSLPRQDAFSYHVSIRDREGKVLARLDGARDSHGLSVDSRGDIYVAAMRRNNLDKFVHEGGNPR